VSAASRTTAGSDYSPDKFERIQLTEETIKLADSYIAEKVVGKTSIADCRHIALATINRVDVLTSWNFKRIRIINYIV